jgi:oligopeptide transport system ATP-binding protein
VKSCLPQLTGGSRVDTTTAELKNYGRHGANGRSGASVLPPLLEVRDLHTEFRTGAGTVPAVDGISYTVERGETVAIVGESGSGKTAGALSILRLIPDPPGRVTGGEILFDGRDLLRLSSEDIRQVRGADIGMIFQEPMTSLNPVLTIGRQITETIEQHRGIDRPAAQKRAVELLAMVGIADPARRLKQYPHQLSGGMRQRIMIAIALACDPKLIIADEPTTALDVTIQAQILELMKELTRRLHVALIIITHNLGVVARYANRVNVMYAGRIVESGPAADVYHEPRHPYTIALLRSVPRLDRPRQARLDPVEGQPPDLTRLDAGCSFRPRCRFAVEACAVARPPLQRAADRPHFAACFRSNEIAIAAVAAERQLQPAGGVAAS